MSTKKLSKNNAKKPTDSKIANSKIRVYKKAIKQIFAEKIKLTKTLVDKQTQELVNKKFGKLVETAQNVFICSMNQDNWDICKRHRLWGVPVKATAAESAIRRTKPGDILLFRLNKGPDYVAMWMVTSKPFEDKKGGPWKKENGSENRDFVWQVKMHPLLVEEFEKHVKLSYVGGINKETGISTKSYMSGMVEITDIQYKILAKNLIEKNLTQLN